MAETAPPKPSAFQVISDLLTAKEIVLILWTIGGGAYLASRVGRMLPAGWDAQDKFWFAVAIFCFGSIVSLGMAKGAMLGWSWSSSALRQRFGTEPSLIVTPHSGMCAVLEIENVGGPCALHARGQIVSVTNTDMHRRDWFFMLWRNDWTNTLMQFVGVKCRKGQPPLKLAVAQVTSDPAGRLNFGRIVVYGGAYIADNYVFEIWRENSPEITVDVTITTDWPHAEPIRRRYAVMVERQKNVVSMRDVTPSVAHTASLLS
jgi:hypothetical protein